MVKEVKKSEAIANVTIPVSTKYSILIGKWVRGRNVDKAIVMLEKVMEKKMPLPCPSYNDSIPHKRGIAAGRYPVKTADYVVRALKLVKNNAKVKGLDESKLIINEFIPNLAISINQRGKYKRGRLTNLKIGVVSEK